jgi:hypothetical protein
MYSQLFWAVATDEADFSCIFPQNAQILVFYDEISTTYKRLLQSVQPNTEGILIFLFIPFAKSK